MQGGDLCQLSRLLPMAIKQTLAATTCAPLGIAQRSVLCAKAIHVWRQLTRLGMFGRWMPADSVGLKSGAHFLKQILTIQLRPRANHEPDTPTEAVQAHLYPVCLSMRRGAVGCDADGYLLEDQPAGNCPSAGFPRGEWPIEEGLFRLPFKRTVGWHLCPGSCGATSPKVASI
jgi:hypothetical protein